MLRYNTEQVASIIALPIIVILLCWTVVIFHKNRKKWGPYDIPIVSVLILSILRNLTIFAYTLAIIFTFNIFNTDYCGIVTWIFNSIHTFQASSLTSIAVIGLFSAKLHRKNQSLRTFLTSTHLVYHLFCLTTLCACVGVAAILAQKTTSTANIFADTDINPCSFLPFELDLKFNVFIIVLHVFLASVSFIAFLMICFNFYKIKREGFEYIKKSNSDLSELSNNFHGINTNVNDNHNRHYYDTYTINRSDNNKFCNNDTWVNNHFNNSEVLSNNSTTVSSTNSRRPCLRRQHEEENEVEVRRTGLETMHPVLIVCYLFYHLPLIVLCIYPRLIQPWPVAGIALWLGLVQDLLIPIGLGIVDSRFCGWVSNVYSCSAKHTDEKLPQVGLDGKFRPFGLSSQPQSLDIQQERAKTLQQVEHRFPITNGSLYTSIDGRLPVIHNYRRHKEFRTGTIKHQDLTSSNVALHSSHLSRRDMESSPPHKYASCTNCQMDQCPSHSDLHHLSPQYVQRKLSFLHASQNNVFASNGENKLQGGDGNNIDILANHQNGLFVGNRRLQNTQNSLTRNQIRIETNRQRSHKRLSQSQESINHLYFGNPGTDAKIGDNIFYHRSDMNISSPNFNSNNDMFKSSRKLLRLNQMRLSRSEDSLTDIQLETPISITAQLREPTLEQKANYHDSSDEEDFFPNSDHQLVKDYDSESSSNSITTEANCDFEFFQAKDSRSSDSSDFDNQISSYNNRSSQSSEGKSSKEKPKHVSNTKITRSNSRRSLENFQAFIEQTCDFDKMNNDSNVSRVVILHRSNSYNTLDDKKKRKRGKKVLSRSNSKISGNLKLDNEIDLKSKINKSVEYLPDSINTAVYSENLKNNNNKFVGNSVPDFRKVFISEYI
ncbi:unnamed protein product [Ceutorhynchus assimilis]|uniref:G-protein coupled receptors family 1 profile domain-containing protein n=1 Tax=Ceutorhynchus assimilis TaxID=467358 RepID=A0A9P0GQ95_9CUCU|nr:unnamed protein product [Ceutorhynchus assimilis]